ncbi:MAG TPA: phosphodiester glycosidase family protein [Pyrinomonadaceae bacterium]
MAPVEDISDEEGGGVRSRFLRAGLLLPLGVLLLLSCGNRADQGKSPRRPDFECPAYAAEGLEVSCVTTGQTTYVVLRVDLRAALVKVLWKNAAGVPYGSLEEAYRQTGGDLLALTNAGIYSASRAPEGLHVEGGSTLSPLNLNVGDGNFYWRPNGVFYVGDGGAGIIESEKFNSPGGPAGVREATQSGPLLVIGGEVNQSLKPDSRSLYVRNGVGMKSPDEVYVVASVGEANLYDFASVFKERLHCRDALYLDGCVSQMYLPARGVYIPGRRQCDKELVGLLGVMKRK